MMNDAEMIQFSPELQRVVNAYMEARYPGSRGMLPMTNPERRGLAAAMRTLADVCEYPGDDYGTYTLDSEEVRYFAAALEDSPSV
jgi:hypothetical protein